jgi:hypothetical protein
VGQCRQAHTCTGTHMHRHTPRRHLGQGLVWAGGWISLLAGWCRTLVRGPKVAWRASQMTSGIPTARNLASDLPTTAHPPQHARTCHAQARPPEASHTTASHHAPSTPQGPRPKQGLHTPGAHQARAARRAGRTAPHIAYQRSPTPLLWYAIFAAQRRAGHGGPVHSCGGLCLRGAWGGHGAFSHCLGLLTRA